MIEMFDFAVQDMMQSFGTTATLEISLKESYDTDTSENIVTFSKIPVKALFFDYMRKEDGLGSERNTLIQSGDKQVFVQPPQKTVDGKPLPHLSPNKDFLVQGGKRYKIVFLKQYNPSMTNDGCVLYELYVRE